MLDGLDEVADQTERVRVSQWTDLQMRNHPKNSFIITSRPHGYQSAPLEEVGVVAEVQPFNLGEIELFIRNWYFQNELMRQMRREDPGVRLAAESQANDLVGRIRQSQPLASMAVNPLLLTMIATVHDNRGALPGRRVELYDEICDVLLGRRQDAKGIGNALTAAQRRAILQVLALELMRRQTRTFTLQSVEPLIGGHAATVLGRRTTAADFIQETVKISGLIVEREMGSYEFAHLSFQEYLAAAEIKNAHCEEILIANINATWWAETIRLYAAQSNATLIIEAAIQKPTVESMTLACDCLEEGLGVDLPTREKLQQWIDNSLKSHDHQVAHFAAEVKLARRLNGLLRMDERVEIDMDYVSCAEY